MNEKQAVFHLHLVLEVICESWGLRNLTPSRQDYLSLWVGKRYEVELQQALAYMVAKLMQMRARREAKHDHELEVIKK